MNEPTIEAVNVLFQQHAIHDEIVHIQRLKGTTSGAVLRLESKHHNKYTLEFDNPSEIKSVEQLLQTYKNSILLPKVLFSAQDSSYFAYTYIDGTTHFNRNSKRNWMRSLVIDLFNNYVEYQETTGWGRLEHPLETWKEFNHISIDEAKMNLGNVLSLEDYNYVTLKSDELFSEDSEQGKKYFLHGDTGVHNFVYNDSKLVGVIDPSPMVGPIIYDFLYAFCSSPDELNLTILFSASELLEQGRVDKTRLIKEALVHLYCRVGLSVKHHPHDLTEYLQAWEEWKQLCKKIDEGTSVI